MACTCSSWTGTLTNGTTLGAGAFGVGAAFSCVCCGQALFSSGAKFESGTGWPSYFQPLSPEAVSEHDDSGFFMRRTEVRCSNCDAHLGHVFPDGPKPTGQRYCMNGVAMEFKAKA